MHRYKILLADDDPEDREIMEEGMASVVAGGITYYVMNGEEVLSYLETCSGEHFLPCIIVLDLNMPCMNGTQTLRAIKKDPRYKHIPVYIYSTSLNPIEKDECLLMGAQAYIIKPVTFKESIETARLFRKFCEQSLANEAGK